MLHLGHGWACASVLCGSTLIISWIKECKVVAKAVQIYLGVTKMHHKRVISDFQSSIDKVARLGSPMISYFNICCGKLRF